MPPQGGFFTGALRQQQGQDQLDDVEHDASSISARSPPRGVSPGGFVDSACPVAVEDGLFAL